MQKKHIKLLLPLLTLTLSGCGQTTDSTPNTPSTSNNEAVSNNESITDSYSEESLSQEEDTIGLIPQEVLDYQGNIDILIYIEGADNTIQDIGSSRYNADSLFDVDLAKYAAAAREFKKIAPGVKINVMYCNIADYDDRIISYNNQKGHYPHIMHPTKNFYEMIENGIAFDVSKYADTEYYQSISDIFMDKLTFGGFTAAFPTHYAPYGMFVNKDILKRDSIVDVTNSDMYEEWVDGLTYDKFLDVCKETTRPNVNAGMSHLFSDAQSFAYPSLYKQYCETGTIDFTNDDIDHLVELESELQKYSAFDYSAPAGDDYYVTAKAEFPEVHNWDVAEKFISGSFTFNTEMPWNIGVISQYAQSAEKGYENFDFMPYPKATENTESSVALGIGGLTIGNQCPISNGVEKCATATSKLEMDVASYFTMFMITDPRAIKAEAEVEWKGVQNKEGEVSVGVVPLPLTKQGFRFSWQDDDEICQSIGGDPAAEYDDNWEYQMSLYLKTYPTWWDDTNQSEPDVKNFSNVSYGLSKVIDIVYNRPEQVIDVRSLPLKIEYGSETIDILEDWSYRYTKYDVSSADYASKLIADLADIEAKVNERTELAYQLLQEMMDMFYGEGKYNVLDKFG